MHDTGPGNRILAIAIYRAGQPQSIRGESQYILMHSIDARNISLTSQSALEIHQTPTLAGIAS